jgi:hypothetical protein
VTKPRRYAANCATIAIFKPNATQSNQPIGQTKRRSSHGGSFAKVLDGRKQPIRGLWIYNGYFYARLSVEDANGRACWQKGHHSQIKIDVRSSAQA